MFKLVFKIITINNIVKNILVKFLNPCPLPVPKNFHLVKFYQVKNLKFKN